MEVTQKQKEVLLNTRRTAIHMFTWVYDVLQQENISKKQYNLLIRIHDMLPAEQLGYIIHNDTLYSVPRKVKKYQKTSRGWQETQLWRKFSPKR